MKLFCGELTRNLRSEQAKISSRQRRGIFRWDRQLSSARDWDESDNNEFTGGQHMQKVSVRTHLRSSHLCLSRLTKVGELRKNCAQVDDVIDNQFVLGGAAGFPSNASAASALRPPASSTSVFCKVV